MVKRNPPRKGRGASGIELFMECTDEALSGSQITAQQVAKYQYDQALAKIRDAHAKARIGKARIINKVDVGTVIPQAVNKPSPHVPTAPVNTVPDRPSSPDIIFVGESPPPQSQPSKQALPAQYQPQPQPQSQPQPRHLVVTSRSPTQNPALNQQQVYKLVNVPQPQTGAVQWVVKPVASVMPQQAANRLANQQTQETGSKRPLTYNQPDQSSKKKLKTFDSKKATESDESGNWVPLDEYYYGKMEGDPTYHEEKNEYRFKCWYCNKMLYNNVKAMMHIQGHIDSSKQQNIDLSDLTQCKHCYKQFDTPFEMQTHVDKVHMSNSNVLLCRICDRDHETHVALMSHMRTYHKACEMPYNCQLCKFRSSMYSDVVDHFKKKHDSSQHLMCLYCLRVFSVKFVSQGWGTTQTYYGHILKHQSKAQNRKCGLCRLSFFNAAEVKAHKQKHHGANHKAVLGTAAHTSKPDQLLIKVPSSQKNSLKSLNAPSVSKVLDFGGTTFPSIVHYYNCYECKMSMGTHDHYRKYVECSMCRFATICSIAYANHMMGFHSGQMSSLNLNIPWERKMVKPMYCLCGFSSQYGNKIADHLVYCMKSTCYGNKPEAGMCTEERRDRDMVDPRTKAGASLLDALGLVQRRTVTPRSGDGVYHRSHDSSPIMTSHMTSHKSKSPDPDYLPSESEESQDSRISRRSSDAIEDENSQHCKSSISETKTLAEKDIQVEKILEKTEKELLDFETEDSNEGLMEEGKIGDIMDSLDEDKLLQDDEQEVKGSSSSGDMDTKGSSVSSEKHSKEQGEIGVQKQDSNDKHNSESNDIDMDDKTHENEIKSEKGHEASIGDDKFEKEEKKASIGDDKSEKGENEASVGDDKPDKDENAATVGDDINMESETSENQVSKCKPGDDMNSEDGANVNQKSDQMDATEEQVPLGSTEDINEDDILEENEENGQQDINTGQSSAESIKNHEILKDSVENETEELKTQTPAETTDEDEVLKKNEATNQKNSEGEANKVDDVTKEETSDSQSDDVTNEKTGNCQSDDKFDGNLNEDENIEDYQSGTVEKPEICEQSGVGNFGNMILEKQSKEERNEDELETMQPADGHVTENQNRIESHDRHVTGGQSQKDVECSSKITDIKTKEVQEKKEDNSSLQRESPSKSCYSKDSHHHYDRRNDRDRGYHDDRNYHRNRSHDYHSDHHRSYDDRRSHDRRSHHYDDRSYHYGGRQDDRNRHGGRHDRDRGYYDNRGCDRRDDRDYRHDDRRRGQGHYQGYGSSYHGYR